MKYKIKNKGISVLIALGGSFLVLLIAFATLSSISKMLSQMESLERSTKLFFAAESGVEAAFYHHNSRGGGVDFLDIGDASLGESQKIPHLDNAITTKWTIDGRSDDLDPDEGTVNAPIIGLLKEGQTVQIPLSWDDSDRPDNSINSTDKIGGASNDYFKITFYRDSNNMPDVEKNIFNSLFGGRVFIPNNFDFGKNGEDGDEILIYWSVSRNEDDKGIQTFTPIGNNCAADEDFICEDLLRTGSVIIDSSEISDTKGIRHGRVLPGYPSDDISIKNFMECSDSAATGNCSNYILTFRPLLKFTSTVDGTKIPGIPYVIIGGQSGAGGMKTLPKQNYTVNVLVSEGDFSQSVSFEVPEKTSIGAFDYVIFD